MYLNYYFEPTFAFSNAYVPALLDWQNPWSNPTRSESGWAVTTFSAADLASDNFVSVYSEENQTAFSIKFDDLPATGNVGVLASEKVDAVRFEYQIQKVNAGSTIAKTYQVLTCSQSSIPELTNLSDMNTLFSYRTAEPLKVECRDFASIIRDNNIGFIVYDKMKFNPDVLNSKWLQLVYANDDYVICKINQIE